MGIDSARLKHDSHDPEDTILEAPGDAGGKRLERLLRAATKLEATDIHLKVGAPPIVRLGGKMRTVEGKPLDAAEVELLVREVMTARQLDTFAHGRDLDFAISVEGVGRFRMNVYRQRGMVSAAIRRVRAQIPGFDELHLPGQVLRDIAGGRQGLVIVCGVTGSGKSTTIASMIEHVNETRRCHIVTIEDPIEYVYKDKKAFVNQREIGIDVEDFPGALKSVVRQDPDVILIGEMRDHATFEAGMQAAETGHLVFGTLHCSGAATAVARILDLFPPEREKAVRQALRANLRAIVSLKLVSSAKKGVAVVPAVEVLMGTSTARKLIGDGEDGKLETVMRSGGEDGMCDFNTALVKMVRAGLITEATALESSGNPEQLKMNLKGIVLGDDKRILG